MSGRIGLVGSGEFTGAMEAVDLALLEGGPAAVVFLPTAAGLEGAERLGYWVALGRDHYRRLGIAATPLLVLDRSDAESPDLAAQVAGAGLVYLSGGDPTHLATTLAGSRVGAAIYEAWLEGTAVAGCSAGAMALMESVPDIRTRGRDAAPGLGLVRGMTVIPHFDQVESWAPGTVRRSVEANPSGTHLVGIDEDTALVGGPGRWTVMGRGAAWVLGRDHAPVRSGDGAVLDLG